MHSLVFRTIGYLENSQTEWQFENIMAFWSGLQRASNIWHIRHTPLPDPLIHSDKGERSNCLLLKLTDADVVYHISTAVTFEITSYYFIHADNNVKCINATARRGQTLRDNRDNNFPWNNFSPIFTSL